MPAPVHLQTDYLALPDLLAEAVRRTGSGRVFLGAIRPESRQGRADAELVTVDLWLGRQLHWQVATRFPFGPGLLPWLKSALVQRGIRCNCQESFPAFWQGSRSASETGPGDRVAPADRRPPACLPEGLTEYDGWL